MIKMHSKSVLFVAVVFIAAGMFAFWHYQSSLETPTVFQGRPFRVVEGVYALAALSPSAAYVIETSDGLILIDAGLELSATEIRRQMRLLGLDPKQIRKILLTHAHGDHVLGARALRHESDAQIYAGVRDAEVLAQGGPREAFFSTFHMPGVPVHPTNVDVALSGGEVIDLGNTRIEVIATPGHTPGSLCFLLERDSKRILFSGDTISTTNPNLDMGTYSTKLSPLYRGDAHEYYETFQRLQKLPVPDLILPGHPQIGETPDKLAVTKQEWEALLQRGVDITQETLARFEADGRDFLDGNPREILPGLFYLGNQDDYPVYCFANEQGLCLFDAPGDDLNEFVLSNLKPLTQHFAPIRFVVLTSFAPTATCGVPSLDPKSVTLIVGESHLSEAREQFGPDWKLETPKTLENEMAFTIESVPTPGRVAGGTCYLLRLGDKQTCVTGLNLFKVKLATLQQWMAPFVSNPGSVQIHLQSLKQLQTLAPNVWLPGVILHEQNANLYGDEWRRSTNEAIQVLHAWKERESKEAGF